LGAQIKRVWPPRKGNEVRRGMKGGKRKSEGWRYRGTEGERGYEGWKEGG